MASNSLSSTNPEVAAMLTILKTTSAGDKITLAQDMIPNLPAQAGLHVVSNDEKGITAKLMYCGVPVMHIRFTDDNGTTVCRVSEYVVA